MELRITSGPSEWACRHSQTARSAAPCMGQAFVATEAGSAGRRHLARKLSATYKVESKPFRCPSCPRINVATGFNVPLDLVQSA